jgi:alkylhydroperoxidase family enzyme
VTWLPDAPPAATSFERALALRPELFEAWRRFTALFWEKRLLDPALLELCRARVGQMIGASVPDASDAMRAAREAFDPRKRDALAEWWNSDLFSDAERDCLRFAEQFVLDPRQIGDADARAVVAQLGDAGTVAFVEVLAILDGFSRFARFVAEETAG